MTISVWRYSHLALAVSSFLFIALAAITGFILAFQPVIEKTQSYQIQNFDQLTLAQTIPALKKTYPGISDLSIDANQFILIKGADAQKKKLLAYADPETGKILGFPVPPNPFFQWVTGLHRSLFLHEIGRLFVGITSFLLLLIAISGTILVVQRQRGVKRFFKRIVKENFAQYYHVVLGRLMLIPIILISLTGTYLSLARFGFFPEKKVKLQVDIDHIKSDPQKKPVDFPIFQHIKLSEVQTIEFPFSDFPEDYYTLKLKDRELAVNQFTGEVLSEVRYPKTTTINNLSLNLHTGKASIIWAIVLAVACINILFFIYSGFVITLKRRSGRIKNKYQAAESAYIILAGSENGSTFRYAASVHQQLLKQGKKAFLAELNQYTIFPQATHLLVLTATYGLGEAPANASKFTNLLKKHPQKQPIKFSVLGFGSHAYPDFCRFAFEVNQWLAGQTWAVPLLDIHTVNDKSADDLNLWAEAWQQQTDSQISLSNQINVRPKNLKKLQVVANTASDNRQTFVLKLKPAQRIKVISGDLLAIYPADDQRERLYSIGVINGELQLSVRLHPQGLGSGYLHRLQPEQMIKARIISNPHFYFPKQASAVILIANGTGISPFLGMIDHNQSKIPVHLYCGFREQASFSIHQKFLNAQKEAGKLCSINLALSREGEQQYVSHLLENDASFISQILGSGGVLMICGSLSMQKDVLHLLENSCLKYNQQPLSFYQSRGQILMDCY